MLRDKDAGEVGRILDDHVEHWYCAGLTGERGRSGTDLAKLLRNQLGQKNISVFETVSEALLDAVRLATKLDHVLVFGSFNTAAQALECPLSFITGIPAPPQQPLN